MPAAIEHLIPHRAPMQWLTALTRCDATTATATACLGEKDFPVNGGTVLETALVECIAQTVAAALGHRAQAGGENGRAAANGMLIAISNFKILSHAVAGKVLHIEVREARRLGPMLLVNGKITCEGTTIATGDLSLYA